MQKTSFGVTQVLLIAGSWGSTKDGLPASYSKFPLAIYFTYGNIYVSILLSQVIPTHCDQKSVLYVC